MIVIVTYTGKHINLFIIVIIETDDTTRESWMRVLNSLIDPRVGGPQLRALTVAKELRNYGIETVFLLPDGSDAFETMATDSGFAVARPGLPRLMPPSDIVGNARFVLGFYPAVRKICSVLQKHDIDIVHASMTLNFQAAVAAKRASVPIAWFFNDTGTPWPINRITAHMARSMADEIAVAADAVYDYFFNGSVEARTVYPPVDTATFDPTAISSARSIGHNEYMPDDHTALVGTVGNINPIKGHTHLLRAIDRVRNHHRSIAVPIVGRKLESRQEYFEKLIQLRSNFGLEEVVDFAGHCNNIPQILAALDVFVLPSLKEACPISLLEAMAMEKAIVATRVGGIPEQIVDGEHGWLVPPGDPEALADAIDDALSSPDERTRRGKAARERAKEIFSLDRCVDRHATMYTAALDGFETGY